MCLCPIILTAESWVCATNRLKLSPREADVAALILNGLAVPSIAQQLRIQPETVRTYVKRLYHKSGARNKLGLVRQVIAAGADMDATG